MSKVFCCEGRTRARGGTKCVKRCVKGGGGRREGRAGCVMESAVSTAYQARIQGFRYMQERGGLGEEPGRVPRWEEYIDERGTVDIRV